MEFREFDHRNYIVEFRTGLSVLWKASRLHKIERAEKAESLVECVKINSTHIGLYCALFSFWNDARWPDIITPSVAAVLNRAMISENTYRKCLKDLQSLGLLRFAHSNSKNEPIRIKMIPQEQQIEVTSNVKILDITTKNEVPSTSNLRSYTKQEKHSINNKKKENDILGGLFGHTNIVE